MFKNSQKTCCLSDGGLAILGLKNNGVGAADGVKILVCGGLNFPGGLDLEEEKALALASTNFRKFSPPAGEIIW